MKLNELGLRYHLEELNTHADQLEDLSCRRGLFPAELSKLAEIYREARSVELQLSQLESFLHT